MRELAKRLVHAIAENERRGWSERNDLPAFIRVRRKGANGRSIHSHMLPLTGISACLSETFKGEATGLEIECDGAQLETVADARKRRDATEAVRDRAQSETKPA